MVESDNNKWCWFVEFKDGCCYGKFGRIKVYELIVYERIRVYKMGGKIMIDFNSIDEYYVLLLRVEMRVS